MKEDVTLEFARLEDLRPQILALLHLHRAAQTEEARASIVAMFEAAFLAAAWHVAHDLLENGWSPGFVSTLSGRRPTQLRVVGGSDAV
jgi:hypothetical protein